MPRELVYNLVNSMMQDMVSKIEEQLVELRAKCSSDIEFIQRTSQLYVHGGYTIYCFNNIPVFYTHLWLEDYHKLNWTIQAGEPPFNWRKQLLQSPTLGFGEHGYHSPLRD